MKNRNAHPLTRREFLSRTAGVTALAFAGPNLLLHGQDRAGKRLNIAVIGAQGKGGSDTQGVANDHNIVALVDADRKRLESAMQARQKAGQNPLPRGFTDFRKMFDAMADEIDAVIVSTPDHTHFAAALWAVRHRKHVCVQKPLCNTIAEVRELHEAARAAGVVTQMGNQGRTMEGQRLVKEWIEQGAIGTLQEIRLWTNRPIWPQGRLTKHAATCPDTLDWDLWLGVEPAEPYFEFGLPAGDSGKRSRSVHPFNWRGWWAFGAGALGDMGCHIMDAAFNVLGQRQPERIEVSSSPVTDRTAPLWSSLVYHIPASGRLPALTVRWNDGNKDGQPNKPQRDPRVPQEEFDRNASGMMFIGSEAVIFADTYCRRPVLFPDQKDDEVRDAMSKGTITQTEPRSRFSGNPQLEWADCIVNGGAPSSNFDYAAPLSEFVLLGNLAVRSGEAVRWDSKALQVTNVTAANRFIKRGGYRAGWL
jgi:predicted dehydrogenase